MRSNLLPGTHILPSEIYVTRTCQTMQHYRPSESFSATPSRRFRTNQHALSGFPLFDWFRRFMQSGAHMITPLLNR